MQEVVPRFRIPRNYRAGDRFYVSLGISVRWPLSSAAATTLEQGRLVRSRVVSKPVFDNIRLKKLIYLFE